MIGDVVSVSRSLSDRVSSQHTESHLSTAKSEEKQRVPQGDTLILQAETDEAEEGCFETLLVLPETPTQLVHRETQLINEGASLAAHSDDEGSGNTEVLPDDVDSHCSGPGFEGDNKRNNFLKPVAHRDTTPDTRHYDSELHAAEKCQRLLDSDATTEEDEGDNVCYLEAVAESRPVGDNIHMEDSLGCTPKSSSTCNLQVIEPLLVSCQRMDMEHQLIETDKSLISKPRIGKHWQGVHSSVRLKDGPMENAFEPDTHGTANEFNTSKATHFLLQTPKSTLDIGEMKYSPCMSTSRSRSRSIASVRAASLRASGLRAAGRKMSIGSGGNDTADEYKSNAMIQLTPGMVEYLPPPEKALEDMPVLEKLSPRISCVPDAKSQQHVDALSLDEAARKGDASDGERQELEAHFRHPSARKVRKLFSEAEELSYKIPASEPEQVVNNDERRDNAMIHALQMGKNDAAEKTVEGYALGGEDLGNLKQQGSISSGFISASTNLSYIESQEPAEESQHNALKVVDKLVWLNGSGFFPDSEPSITPQQTCMKGSRSGKGVQSLAHTAEIKNMQDKLHVYDWIDSQQDEVGVCLDIKEVSGPLETQKKHRGKRQTGSQHHRSKAGLRPKYRSDVTASKEKTTASLIGRTVASLIKSAECEHVPQTLTTQNRNISEVESERIQKIGKVSSLEYRHEQMKYKKSTKLLEHEVSNGLDHSQVDDKKCLLSKPAIESSRKTRKESLRPSEFGAEATDIMTPDLKSAEAPTNTKENERNQIEMPKGINVKEMKFRKRGVVNDDIGQEGKGNQTRLKTSVSAKISQFKYRKRVKWASSVEEQCQFESNQEGHKIENKFVQRIPKTRSTVHAINMPAGSRTDKVFSVARGIGDNGTMQNKAKGRLTTQKEDKPSRSSKRAIASASHIWSEDKPIVRKDVMIPVIRQCSSTNTGQQDLLNEVGGGFKELLISSPALMSIDKKEELLLSGLTNRHNLKDKRKRETAGGNLKKRPLTRQHSAMNIGQQDVMNRIKENAKYPAALVSINGGEESPPMIHQIHKKYKREREAPDGRLNKGPVTRRQFPMNIGQQEEVKKDGGYKADVNLSPSHGLVVDTKDGTSLQKSESKNNRKRKDSDGVLIDISEAHRLQSQKHMSPVKRNVFNIQNALLNDVSCSPILRRTRSRLYALGPTGRNIVIAKGQSDAHDSRGHADLSCDGQTLPTKIHTINFKNTALHQKDGGIDEKLARSFNRTATTNRSKTMRHEKKRMTARFKTPTMSGFTPTLEGGRRRKREPCCIYVLFSHGLHEDTIKHQKKILAKLGGQTALSAANCTHFVADSFVRTRNMLQCMAAGKAVVTPLWLESCGQACYFVDEKNFILEDAKKEKNMGFSMHSSLAAAQREPIFKGLKILISPNTTPKFEAMTAIVEAAGGQAMQMPKLSKMDTSNDDDISFIIACAEDYELCLHFLHKGFNVYSVELVLNGVVRQNLDFSRNQLFEQYRRHTHSSRRQTNFKL